MAGANEKRNYERSEEREIVTITLPSDDDDTTTRGFRFAHEVVSKCTDGRAHEDVPAFTLMLRKHAEPVSLYVCWLRRRELIYADNKCDRMTAIRKRALVTRLCFKVNISNVSLTLYRIALHRREFPFLPVYVELNVSF